MPLDREFYCFDIRGRINGSRVGFTDQGFELYSVIESGGNIQKLITQCLDRVLLRLGLFDFDRSRGGTRRASDGLLGLIQKNDKECRE